MAVNNIIDRLSNGAIFEVPLLGDNGYAYIKLQKFYKTENGVEIMNSIFRVINYYSKTRVKGDINFMSVLEYTYVPLILLGIPKIKGKSGWKHIGDILPREGDEVIPYFSFTMNMSTLCGYNDTPFESINWSVIKKLTMIGDSCMPATFNDIKGLGFYSHIASILFNVKLTLFWNRKLLMNLDIDELLKKEGLYQIVDMDLYNVLINIEAPM